MNTHSILPLLCALSLALAALPAGAQHPPPSAGGLRCSTGHLDPAAPPHVPSEAPFSFALSFDPALDYQMVNCATAAAAEWAALSEVPGGMVNPAPIHFQMGPLPALPAETVTTWNASGVLQGSTVTIKTGNSYRWYVGCDAQSASSYNASGQCIDPVCADNTDFLSVMRHSIGHAIGWVGFAASTQGPQNPYLAGLISGNLFDPTRLKVTLLSGSSPDPHPVVAGTNDVMEALNVSFIAERRAISLYPDLSVIARAYNHTTVLRFIDRNTPSATQNGSADFPWVSFAQADAQAPSGARIAVIPGTYDEVNPLVLNGTYTHLIIAGSGSAVIR